MLYESSRCIYYSHEVKEWVDSWPAIVRCEECQSIYTMFFCRDEADAKKFISPSGDYEIDCRDCPKCGNEDQLKGDEYPSIYRGCLIDCTLERVPEWIPKWERD